MDIGDAVRVHQRLRLLASLDQYPALISLTKPQVNLYIPDIASYCVSSIFALDVTYDGLLKRRAAELVHVRLENVFGVVTN
jgi:hypothetical protein